jgi:hypothetical protein
MRRSLLILLAAPLALVACGGGSNHNSSAPPVKLDPVAYVRHAAHKTAGLSAEHMTTTGKVSVLGTSVSVTGSGDFSNAQHRGSFVASFSAAGRNGKIDEVLDGTTIYMSSPLFARQLPAGKKWMKLDLGQLGKANGVNYSTLMSQTPAQALKRLEAAGTVTQLGADTIDGVATTRFRVDHLDITKLPQGAKIEALAHPTYGPIEVWIGKRNGYIYRETMSFSYSVQGQQASMTMTSDFSKFGESVRVSVPGASETVDATSQAIQGAAA